MDTPGFSSLYVEDLEKEDLKYYFPEFAPYEGSCRFNGCDHIHEPGCAVKQAVEEGKIHPSRYENYKAFYEELKGTEEVLGMEYILAPSILAADFKNLGCEMKKTEENGAEYLHFDVMDGMFVPSISFGMPVLASICGATEQVMDVHLMIKEPIRYIEDFKKAGADLITIHLEACEDVHATIAKIRECGMKAGLSICPETDTEELAPYLKEIDMVLIMSVHPGFGGQSFIPESLSKIRRTRQMIAEQELSVDVEVDGGIYLTNVKDVLDAGANIIVAGSAVFKGDAGENTKNFMEILKSYE